MSYLMNQVDRRGTSRFAVERAVRFKVTGKRNQDEPGRGRTINMSSNGVFFTTETELAPGKRLELSVSWPAQLNDTCPLKLVAKGRVVRTEPGRAAIEIQTYEFRTLGAAGFPA